MSSGSASGRWPTRRVAVVGVAVAAVAGVAVSAGLVWQASYSAFSAQTTTPAENWTAGTVALTNGQGSALFTVQKLKPGTSLDRCVTVTSSGNLPAAVKLYTTTGSYGSTNNLAANVNLFVGQSSTAANSACTNYTGGTALYNGSVDSANLSDFGTTKTSFANGVGTWNTTGTPGEFMVFKFRWQFTVSTPGYTQADIDAFQAGTAQIGFTWEAQNT